MARIVPSLVVALIDQSFPTAAQQQEGQDFTLTMGHATLLAAIVDLVERVPDELVALDGHDFATLRVCMAGIKSQITYWFAHGDQTFNRIGGLPHLSPVTLIRRMMVKCPDQAPAPGTTELAFIGDKDLRESIRLDISAANRDSANGEWKGATVLSGSAVEALLLWALHQRPAEEITQARAKAVQAERLSKDPGSDLERWHLRDYVEVAGELGIIKSGTVQQARLAQDFRNLIHPGRAARLGQKCDRGSALSALAAVELVVRDLTPP